MQIFLPQSQIENNNQLTFSPIAKKYSIPYEKYELNAEKSSTIVSKNGNVIIIPANCFVNELGNLITGKVDIYFREIRTAADIITNNIRMNVKENGTNYTLQTSGMFELRGFRDKTPIKIREGKTIKVEYVSNSSQVFDNYYYDENKKEWIKSGIQKQNTKSDLVPLIKPVLKTKNDYTIKAKIDFSDFPNFNVYSGVEWKYLGNENIGQLELKLQENLQKQEVQVIDFNTLTFKYTLSSLTNPKNRVELLLQPVFSDQSYSIALAQYEERLKLIAQMAARRKQLLTEKNILNQFSVNKFSYQNCDVVYRYPGHIFVNASFSFGNQQSASKNIKIYLITENDSVVMKFENDFTKFNFNPQKNNKIIGIEEGNRLGVIASKDFKNLKIQPNSAFPFQLTEITQDMETLENFNSLIQKL